jgi:hypothetical protein
MRCHQNPHGAGDTLGRGFSDGRDQAVIHAHRQMRAMLLDSAPAG